MRQEVKDRIIDATSLALTIGTSTMLGIGAGLGTVALINHVFVDGLPRAQAKLLGAVVTVGSIGIGWTAVRTLQPKFEEVCKEILDIFPTTEMKEVNDADS